MRDVYDRKSLLLEVADQAKQLIDLAIGERRSRLIHHEHSSRFECCTGYLDQLSIRRAEARNKTARIDVETAVAKNLGGAFVNRALVDYLEWREGQRFAPKEDVVGNSEVTGKRELLIDHRDPSRERIPRTGKPEGLAFD